jgi:2-phosphosulfolactate phosphatase
VRFGWGLHGLRDAADGAQVVVIVDVLSFSTTVAVATARGAEVWATDWDSADAADAARRHGAQLARRRREVGPEHPYSLSPASVLAIEAGTRLVLPSPNGARLCADARDGLAMVLVGCLRNRTATAAAAAAIGTPVAVVAAGERWADGSLRPAFEDLMGAGAVIDRLVTAHGLAASSDARAAAAAFVAADLPDDLARCPSGRELAAAGFPEDVALAGEIDVEVSAAVMSANGWIRGGAAAAATAGGTGGTGGT